MLRARASATKACVPGLRMGASGDTTDVYNAYLFTTLRDNENDPWRKNLTLHGPPPERGTDDGLYKHTYNRTFKDTHNQEFRDITYLFLETY